jgi:conjugative relaxase-like TrwC/TraI family protein
MVTAKTQTNLASAKDYFAEHLAVGEYYAEGQSTRGVWFGQGAQRLGLPESVTSDEFLSLCDNRHPRTGLRLTQRTNQSRIEESRTVGNRRVFFDFAFSPPKSVSILALVQKDDRLSSAHHLAVKSALGEFENFVATRIRRGGVKDQRMTGNFVAALFTHETSRALDPHLHTHCIVFNATLDPVENRWKALENHELLRARKYAESVYYHELAKELRRFGYGIGNKARGDFEVLGVSESLCRRFSKRHEQIESALDDLLREKPELAGRDLGALKERLAEATRARKAPQVPAEELRKDWSRQITNEEQRQLDGLASGKTISTGAPSRKVVAEAVEWAEEHLFDRNAVVPEHELWRAALDRLRGHPVTVAELKRHAAGRDHIRQPGMLPEITTRLALQREAEIVGRVRNGVSKFRPISLELPDLSVGLEGEQKAAFHDLLSSRNAVTLFRGGAGTGKSHVLRELATVVQRTGRAITVLAPQRQQVLDLEQAGLPSPATVSQFLTRKPSVKGHFIIVDEAGQIGAGQMLELIRAATDQGARLLLSGDTRQHGPVEASDSLAAIERFSGVQPVELKTIRRQDPSLGETEAEQRSIARYRDAVAQAASGRLAESFRVLDEMGAIVQCPFNQQAERIAEEYLRLSQTGQSLVVVSQTWSEVRRINEQVRSRLKDAGVLGREEIAVQALERLDLTNAQKRDARHHEPGTVVILNQKVADLPPGSTAKFRQAVAGAVLLETDDKLVRLSNRFLDRITVCRESELKIAPGERLQLKANRRLMDGRRINNGELITVRSVEPDGTLHLDDGRTLDRSCREFIPGYAVTSYGSQGKTVAHVLFSDSTVKAATNDQQWYVTISRGRKGVRIFTPDKELLRDSVLRSGQRKLALDLAGFADDASLRLGMMPWLRRFGAKAARLIAVSRRHTRFTHETRHEQRQGGQMLDHRPERPRLAP